MTDTSTVTDTRSTTLGEPILVAEDLVKHYPIKGGVLRRTVGHVKAVDGVSFTLHKGCLLYTSRCV